MSNTYPQKATGYHATNPATHICLSLNQKIKFNNDIGETKKKSLAKLFPEKEMNLPDKYFPMAHAPVLQIFIFLEKLMQGSKNQTSHVRPQGSRGHPHVCCFQRNEKILGLTFSKKGHADLQ